MFHSTSINSTKRNAPLVLKALRRGFARKTSTQLGGERTCIRRHQSWEMHYTLECILYLLCLSSVAGPIFYLRRVGAQRFQRWSKVVLVHQCSPLYPGLRNLFIFFYKICDYNAFVCYKYDRQRSERQKHANL